MAREKISVFDGGEVLVINIDRCMFVLHPPEARSLWEALNTALTEMERRDLEKVDAEMSHG